MNTLIIGGTSGIAQSVARLAVARGDRVFLAGRNMEKLAIVARDLETRSGQPAGFATADFLQAASIERLLAEAAQFLGKLDAVLIAHGVLPDQAECELSWDAGAQALEVNFISPALIAAAAARVLSLQKHGALVVIGSVAGDRGRKSNFYYGAAKGGLERFVQGLRAQLLGDGVRVILIKPGMVDTPMTAHLRKGPLFAQPEAVARTILRSFSSGPETVYTPWIWWGIMAVIRAIPERIFKKLSL
jgi:short-subunit dehydrogenase